MKRVFLFAYSQCNLGDDLFIHVLVKRYKSARFFLYGDRNSRLSVENNLKIVEKDNWLIQLVKSIRPSFAAKIRNFQEERCDATVYIGGSLFIEYNNWETILTWWKYVAEHRKFFVLGANFGPWHTEAYRKQMAEIFSKMKDVCFRDKYSKSLFPNIPNVRYAPDILFGYPMPETGTKFKQAFVSVINCETKDEGDNKLSLFDKQYVKALANLVESLVVNGWRIVLSSFCKNEGDEEGIKKILQEVKDSSTVEIVNYDGTNAYGLLTRLAESEIVYGSRFHAVILGLAARRPVVPIIYSDKTRRVLEDIGFSGRSFDVREMKEDAGFRMSEIAADSEPQRIGNIKELSDQSNLHFEKLDLLLG